jgi:hypothetical protein
MSVTEDDWLLCRAHKLGGNNTFSRLAQDGDEEVCWILLNALPVCSLVVSFLNFLAIALLIARCCTRYRVAPAILRRASVAIGGGDMSPPLSDGPSIQWSSMEETTSFKSATVFGFGYLSCALMSWLGFVVVRCLK